MSKYIIELDDRIKLVTSVGVTENGVVYTTSDYVHNLEELNSDYINEHFGELQDEAYQAGLNDAWEAAKKICCNPPVGLDYDTLNEIFGTRHLISVMAELSAGEVIDMIKAYEDKRSDRIEVGDEVKHDIQGIGVVTRIREVNGKTYYNAVWSSGNTGYYEPDDLTKTGKHYDIQSILEAMRK